MVRSVFHAAIRSQEERFEMDQKQPHVGDVIIFTDSYGDDRNALVIAVFGDVHAGGEMPCLNAVWVSKDASKKDNGGRQIERDQTSIVHVTHQSAHGNYWRWPGEEKNPYTGPTES
jgi:hypothetical protein